MTSSGSGYDFDSVAFTENGLTSADEGGVITCIGTDPANITLHFSG